MKTRIMKHKLVTTLFIAFLLIAIFMYLNTVFNDRNTIVDEKIITGVTDKVPTENITEKDNYDNLPVLGYRIIIDDVKDPCFLPRYRVVKSKPPPGNYEYSYTSEFVKYDGTSEKVNLITGLLTSLITTTNTDYVFLKISEQERENKIEKYILDAERRIEELKLHQWNEEIFRIREELNIKVIDGYKDCFDNKLIKAFSLEDYIDVEFTKNFGL